MLFSKIVGFRTFEELYGSYIFGHQGLSKNVILINFVQEHQELWQHKLNLTSS